MQLFYTPDISPQANVFVLNETESKHAVRVLRMASGDAIHLVDGHGGRYTGVITDAHPKRTVLELRDVQTDYGKRGYYLHVAIAPTKNVERVEWLLEKATEVGVDEITPVICAHSERKEVKYDRLNKVLVAAMKQSLKAYLPKLNETTRLPVFLGRAEQGSKYIAHCAEGEKRYLNQVLPPSDRCTILIGPEGDFSPAEIQQAMEAGYTGVTFGNTRLRTETAALIACSEVAMLNR